MSDKDTEITFHHRLPLQIRFNDVDMFGHVNNAMYLQYLDMGKMTYFNAFTGRDFTHEPTVPVVVNVNIDFKAPTRIHEIIFVETAMEHVGDSSMVLAQRVVNAEGAVKCAARTVMVNIDAKTGAPTPVDGRWRNFFNEMEGREV